MVSILMLQPRTRLYHGLRYRADSSYFDELNNKEFNGVVVYYTEFYDECKKIQFRKKDKDWYYWEKTEVEYKNSIELEYKLFILEFGSYFYDVVTYHLDRKSNYPNISVSLDPESTGIYSVYDHTPINEELEKKPTRILINNKEIKIKAGTKYEKKLFFLSAYFLINKAGKEDGTVFLIKFLESNHDHSFGTVRYYTKTKDTDEEWSFLDIPFEESQRRLRRLLFLELVGSDFKKFREEAYSVLNGKESSKLLIATDGPKVVHKNVSVTYYDKHGNLERQHFPFQPQARLKEKKHGPTLSEIYKNHPINKRKCDSTSKIQPRAPKNGSSFPQQAVVLLEKQCSYTYKEIEDSLKKASQDPEKIRLMNDKTDITAPSETIIGDCLKYGFGLVKQHFEKHKDYKENNKVELKIVIKSDFADKSNLLRLYETDTSDRTTSLYYSKGKDDFYVYFYGNDPRPLLFIYEGEAYRPHSIFDYYDNWYKVRGISDFSCIKDKSSKLLDELGKVVLFLNVVQLRSSQFFTYSGTVDVEVGTSARYLFQNYEGKSIAAKVTYSKNQTYHICTHVPDGLDNKGNGFRLGMVTYEGSTNASLDYDPKRELVSVNTFYYLSDKELKNPVLIELEFKSDIFRTEEPPPSRTTEPPRPIPRPVPEPRPPPQPPPATKSESAKPPTSAEPLTPLTHTKTPPTTSQSRPSTTHPSTTSVVKTPSLPAPATPQSKPDTRPTDSRVATGPELGKDRSITHSPSPGGRAAPSPPPPPSPHIPPSTSHRDYVQPSTPSGTEKSYFVLKTPVSPASNNEFDTTFGNENTRWVQTKITDTRDLVNPLTQITSQANGRMEKQSQSRPKDDGESTNITLIGGSVGGGVAGVGLIGGGAVAAVKYPFLLIPSIKPLL
nr:hypothetical protein MACL_00002534 [Theileria orientalis]